MRWQDGGPFKMGRAREVDLLGGGVVGESKGLKEKKRNDTAMHTGRGGVAW